MRTAGRAAVALALTSLLLGARVPASGAAENAPVSVGGVHLHDSEETARGRLGAPLRRVSSPPNEELGLGEVVELQYSGLKVGLNRPKGQQSFTVNEIHVSSRRWPLSNGVAVGMSRDAIRERLGGGGEESADRLVYALGGNVRLAITLREGRAFTIDLQEVFPAAS